MLAEEIDELSEILELFADEILDYSYKEYLINKKEKVFVIEDVLVLYVGFLTYSEHWSGLCWTEYKKGEEYYFKIEELTYNDINFKINTAKFNQKCLEKTGKSILISYYKFFRKEARCLDWRIHKMFIQKRLVEPIGSYIPELKLFERIRQWKGIKYNFIVMEVSGYDNKKGIGVFITTVSPYRYVQQKCNDMISNGWYWGVGGGVYEDFHEALNSWRGKGLTRKKIIEDKLKYYCVEEYIKDKNKLFQKQDKILENAIIHNYNHIERNSFIKPVNKWKMEELVYKCTKKLYKNYNVIYQYRPFFLRSEKGGQMSYDVFIAKLNIAIEYQGKQHFEPVDFFGGEEGFKNTIVRDKIKKELSEKNGIRLIYINHWENVTAELIKQKIKEVENS